MASRGSVVVTGASTGIGSACVKVLTASGFHVFGSVRRPEDADRLTREFGASFTPLFFDITDQTAVAGAAQTVERALAGATLAGLVNNAGIAVAGPLLYLRIGDFERQFAVNVTGQLIVTQAFAPLLGTDRSRKGAPGRIVMISSVGGRNALPLAGPYAASKFAIEGLSEALRRELMLFGIDVVIVAPGAVVTPIWGKSDNRVAAFANTPYAAAVDKMKAFMLAIAAKGLPPERIGEAVKTAPHRTQAEDPLHGRAQSVPAIPDYPAAQAPGRPHDRPANRAAAARAMTHQPPPRSDGKLPVTITHLELASQDWTRRGRPPAIEVEIAREPAPTAACYLDLYDRVGRDWLWYERRLLGEEALTVLLNRPGHEVHVARHDGALVGYFELYDNEIVFFGLAPGYIGRRIGPWLLDRAIERGFARGAEKLILNTNTIDHPRALDTYRKAGFRIVGREEKELQDPRVLWPDIYRWLPK